MTLSHLGTQRLETPRLILRRFTLDDAAAMFTNWASDPAVTEHLRWPPHPDQGVSEAILGGWVDAYASADTYTWAVELKSLGEPIGSIGAVTVDDDLELAEVGYCIGQPWWHQGIASEALGEVIRFLLSDVGLNRVEAIHSPDNPHSGNVMRKCGMHHEGTLRDRLRSNQGLSDAEMYAVMAADCDASALS